MSKIFNINASRHCISVSEIACLAISNIALDKILRTFQKLVCSPLEKVKICT